MLFFCGFGDVGSCNGDGGCKVVGVVVVVVVVVFFVGVELKVLFVIGVLLWMRNRIAILVLPIVCSCLVFFCW